MMTVIPNLLTAREVAVLLKVSQTTVYDMASSGQLPYVRVGVKGGRYRFQQADIEAYLSGNRVASKPAPQRRRSQPRNMNGFDLLRAAGWKG